MIALNRIAIAEGLEGVKELRQDSTVIKTNIHSVCSGHKPGIEQCKKSPGPG
jgi:hypothetical protein